MVHYEEVRCDLCDKEVSKEQTQRSMFLRDGSSKYELELTTPKTNRRLDLCKSCYHKCLKRIGFKKKS